MTAAPPPPPPTTSVAVPVRIVGIGASAGGLDALEQFLGHVPPGCGLAFIVVQHLDPTQKAMLAQLLQRSTPMPVAEAAEGMRIEAGHVYVIPPNSALTVSGGSLHLATPQQPRGLRLPVDALFESLAREWHEQAIGVVLSGMGSDGTAGLRSIHANGGLTLAQDPDSAQFDSMPRSAIEAGCVDIVAAAGELPRRVLATLTRESFAEISAGDAVAPGAPAVARPPDEPATGLAAILRLLQRRGKHDFTLYKHSTLLRRIERRMGIHRLPTMDAYAAMLDGNEQELELLFKELLIGVTGFFRDTPVWEALKSEVLPRLLAERGPGHALRAWVVGCSTGEEAYSLAMTYREVQEAAPGQLTGSLQVFATDLSKDAIDTARRGSYPAAIAGEVSAQRLARFFARNDEGYRIAKSIREMVVFAPHDVAVDPPFTKLDLLSCRNLLIYLTAPLQKRLMPLFHYSLRPGGVLLLGSSETVGRFESLFEPLDAKLRLFRRGDKTQAQAVPEFPLRAAAASHPISKENRVPDDSLPPSTLQAAADRVLLQDIAPPAVLVTDRGDIVYINGRTGKYLEPAAGKANWNIHVMAREGIRAPLAAALEQALAQTEPVQLTGLPVEAGPGASLVDISVRALVDPPLLAGMAMIVFRDLGPAEPSRRRRRSSSSVHRELEGELQRARDEAQALREEMRASQEELQAANEELQSTNEELQSTNEELTSSKEEMQSMNEELQAVNVELQSKIADLELAQSDMRNLLNSTDIATLFLDRDLNVRRFTERARKIISLRDSDVGRPLSDLTTHLQYPELQSDVRDMLRTLIVSEKQIRGSEGQWFSVRVMPYRTHDNVIDGAVITFVDITAAKELEARLRST
jgi:two-component system, chemotaxis family, CheB/CheR fusion protein